MKKLKQSSKPLSNLWNGYHWLNTAVICTLCICVFSPGIESFLGLAGAGAGAGVCFGCARDSDVNCSAADDTAFVFVASWLKKNRSFKLKIPFNFDGTKMR